MFVKRKRNSVWLAGADPFLKGIWGGEGGEGDGRVATKNHYNLCS
jgi:hypothetical protein